MKKFTNRFLNGFFSRVSWLSGIIIGMTFSSLLIWAAPLVIPNVFTSGTPISSAQVNANFAAIRDKINQNDFMLITGMTTDQIITKASSNNIVQMDKVLKDSIGGTAYDLVNSTLTIPAAEGGLYTIYFQGSTTAADCMAIHLAVVVNGVNQLSSYACNSGLYTGNKKLILQPGDSIKVIADAVTETVNYSISAADILLVIKRDAKL